MPPSRDGRRPVGRLIVGITGRDGGVVYGVRLLEALRAASVETHLVMCDCSRETIRAETGRDPDAIRSLADHAYGSHNQAARISSGSFLTDGMIVAPCSSKSLASIALGLATNLVHRAADVAIKEGRKVVLLLRDPPTGPIESANLDRLRLAPVHPVSVVLRSSGGGPTPDVVDRTVDRLLDQFGIGHPRS